MTYRVRTYTIDGRKRSYPLPRDFYLLQGVDLRPGGESKLRLAMMRVSEIVRTAPGVHAFMLAGNTIRFLPKLRKPARVDVYYLPKPSRRK